MSRNHRRSVGHVVLLLASCSAFAQQPQSPAAADGAVPAKRPAGCTSTESRQFDFWLGEWDVSPTGQSVILAESTISLHAQGCVILENWRPFQGAQGLSINSFDVTDQLWHQEYVDASGARSPYSGRFAAGVMRLDDLRPAPPNAPAGLRRRMNFQALDPNTVRQWGEASADAREWKVTWDLTYRRRAGTRP
jgi:hypothetical protein